MEGLGAALGFALIVLVIVHNIGAFVWHRRCPHCKRWFVGKKMGAYTTDYSRTSGKVWDYTKSRYQRETRTSGTVHVSMKCRKCGHSYGCKSRFSTKTNP